MINVITNNRKIKSTVTGSYEELTNEFFVLIMEFNKFLSNMQYEKEEELQ